MEINRVVPLKNDLPEKHRFPGRSFQYLISFYANARKRNATICALVQVAKNRFIRSPYSSGMQHLTGPFPVSIVAICTRKR